uniref:Uncharacterized protein n=1 Tax=Rhizophora mucronata TaxID=61149 RepID=A0A2P2NBZ5_RHIMU
MKRVLSCASIMPGTKVATRIGIIFNICLVSSTCVTVQSIHGLVDPVFTAALLRNLMLGVKSILYFPLFA